MKASTFVQLVFIICGFLLLCTLPKIDGQNDDDSADAFDGSNDDGIAIAGDVSDDATGQKARITYRNFDARELSADEEEYEDEDEDVLNTETYGENGSDEEPRLDIRSWGNDVPNYARKLKKSQVFECEENECFDWCRVLLRLSEGRCDDSGKCFCLSPLKSP